MSHSFFKVSSADVSLLFRLELIEEDYQFPRHPSVG